MCLPNLELRTFGARLNMEKAKTLTKRESEIAELFAWGASKKDIANRLFVSERTVENHTRNIYEKTGCSKVNKLSAWWFCKTFHISFDLSPFKRNAIVGMMLLLMIPQMIDFDNVAVRTRTNTCRIVRTTRARRKSENDNATVDFTV